MNILLVTLRAIRKSPRVYVRWIKKVSTEWRSATLDERLAGLVAVTLPFERVPALDVAGFTVRLSMVFGSVLVIRFLITWWRNGLGSKLNWPERLLLLFAGWSLVLLVLASNIRLGLQVVLPTVYVVFLALAIGRLVRTQKLTLMIALVCTGAAAASLFGIYQFIGDYAGLPHWMTAMRPEYSWQRFGFPRILSAALEPLFFSAYLLLPLSFVLALFGRDERPAHKAALLGLAVLFIGVDILTVSRGGILALGMLLLVTAVFVAFSGKRRAAMRYIGRLAIVVVVALSIGLGLLAVFNRQGQDSDVTYNSRGLQTLVRHLMNTRLTPNQENIQKEDSLAARSSARDYAARVATKDLKNFMVGVGPGQFQEYNRMHGERSDLVVANVLPLDIMLNSGFVGLALLGGAVVLLFLRLLKLVRAQSTIAAALAAYMLAIGLQSLTFPTLYITHIWFAIGLALLLVVKIPKKQNR